MENASGSRTAGRRRLGGCCAALAIAIISLPLLYFLSAGPMVNLAWNGLISDDIADCRLRSAGMDR